MNTMIGSHKGYKIFKDEAGFYIIGLNGLGQDKKIIRPTIKELTNWIDASLSEWLGVN